MVVCLSLYQCRHKILFSTFFGGSMRAKVPSRRHEAELDVATPGDRKGERQRLQRIRMMGVTGVLSPPRVFRPLCVDVFGSSCFQFLTPPILPLSVSGCRVTKRWLTGNRWRGGTWLSTGGMHTPIVYQRRAHTVVYRWRAHTPVVYWQHAHTGCVPVACTHTGCVPAACTHSCVLAACTHTSCVPVACTHTGCVPAACAHRLCTGGMYTHTQLCTGGMYTHTVVYRRRAHTGCVPAVCTGSAKEHYSRRLGMWDVELKRQKLQIASTVKNLYFTTSFYVAWPPEGGLNSIRLCIISVLEVLECTLTSESWEQEVAFYWQVS